MILKRDLSLANAVPGPSVASALLVLEQNNNSKKDRAFEHLLTVGKNQHIAAAAVQLGPCCRRTLNWKLTKYHMAGVPRCGLVKGRASTRAEEKALQRAFMK